MADRAAVWSSLTEVDSLRILAVVDNETDKLSSAACAFCDPTASGVSYMSEAASTTQVLALRCMPAPCTCVAEKKRASVHGLHVHGFSPCMHHCTQLFLQGKVECADFRQSSLAGHGFSLLICTEARGMLGNVWFRSPYVQVTQHHLSCTAHVSVWFGQRQVWLLPCCCYY